MSLGISYAGYRTGWPRPIIYEVDGQAITAWDGVSFGGGAENYRAVGVEGIENVVGPGTRWPWGFNVKDYTALVWRVREFSIAHTWDSERTLMGTTSTYSTISTPTFEPVYRSPSEPDLPEALVINEQNFFLSAFGKINNSLTMVKGTDDPEVIAIAQFFQVALFTTRYYDGLFWPEIVFECVPAQNDPESGSMGPRIFSYAIKNTLTSSHYTSETVADLIFEMGVGVASKQTKLHIGDSDPSSFGFTIAPSATGTITLTASRFWGYGGKFNTATGAKL